jgi:hypothetical protein
LPIHAFILLFSHASRIRFLFPKFLPGVDETDNLSHQLNEKHRETQKNNSSEYTFWKFQQCCREVVGSIELQGDPQAE